MECWPDTDLLVLVCQMPAIAIVVVVGLHLLPSLTKKVLDTPLGCQIVVVTWILCDLDLPLPGGHCCSKLCPRPCAQLESQLIAASWGLHIHWWKKIFFAAQKFQPYFCLLCCPELTPQMLGGAKPVGFPTLNWSIRHWPWLERRTVPVFYVQEKTYDWLVKGLKCQTLCKERAFLHQK